MTSTSKRAFQDIIIIPSDSEDSDIEFVSYRPSPKKRATSVQKLGIIDVNLCRDGQDVTLVYHKGNATHRTVQAGSSSVVARRNTLIDLSNLDEERDPPLKGIQDGEENAPPLMKKGKGKARDDGPATADGEVSAGTYFSFDGSPMLVELTTDEEADAELARQLALQEEESYKSFIRSVEDQEVSLNCCVPYSCSSQLGGRMKSYFQLRLTRTAFLRMARLPIHRISSDLANGESCFRYPGIRSKNVSLFSFIVLIALHAKAIGASPLVCEPEARKTISSRSSSTT